MSCPRELGSTHEGCPGLPDWCVSGARFTLNGQRYQIVAIGSDNRRAPKHDRFECNVVAAPVAEPWSLPKEGTPIRNVADAFARLRRLPTFHADELERALR